jgi:hypothetical protein
MTAQGNIGILVDDNGAIISDDDRKAEVLNNVSKQVPL